MDEDGEFVLHELTIRQVLDADGDKVIRIAMPESLGEQDQTALIGVIERAKFHLMAMDYSEDDEEEES